MFIFGIFAFILCWVNLSLLLVNNNQEQSITTPPAPNAESVGDYIYQIGPLYFGVMDLSQQFSLKILQLYSIVLLNLILPTTTSSPVAINLDRVTLKGPINTFPNTMTTCILNSGNSDIMVNGTALSAALGATSKLLHLFLYRITSVDFFALPNISFPSLDGYDLSNANDIPTMEIYYVQTLTSIGDFSINSDLVLSSSFTFQIEGCGNLTNIGNSVLVTTVPISNSFYIIENNILNYVGNINVSKGLYIVVNYNPMLQNIGRITIVNPSNGMLGDFRLNNLPASVISQILIDYDATGATGGTLHFAGNPGTGLINQTPAGVTAYNNLVAKLWSINF